MENTDLAYTAGIIDGEGSILVEKLLNKSRKENQVRHCLRVNVTNTDYNLIIWLKENFGGSIWSYDLPSYRKCYHWKLNGVKASAFLKSLLPYLKVKQQQAKLAVSFQETIILPKDRVKGIITPELLKLRDDFKYFIHQLNSGGQINAII